MKNGKADALITGGAGFIGSNLAMRLLRAGKSVLVLDDFSREGVERNARTLSEIDGSRLTVVRGDVRDRALVNDLVRGANSVFHFAAQVAVTTSLLEPVADFEINTGGTLSVLEALRRNPERVPLIYTSTNKVYGALPQVQLDPQETRYEPSSADLRDNGVSELFALDFHSPYGCSKGAADQYVLDYARSFGLPALVFRMSCIYGPHQCGNEDQGWVAHFLRRIHEGKPITLFGDGRQIRDILFIDDLVDAFLCAEKHAERLAGQAFNIGGGPKNTTSLLELLQRARELTGLGAQISWQPARVGDQRYYVSDVRRFSAATGWSPRTTVAEGVAQLDSWLVSAASRDDMAPSSHVLPRLTETSRDSVSLR